MTLTKAELGEVLTETAAPRRCSQGQSLGDDGRDVVDQRFLALDGALAVGRQVPVRVEQRAGQRLGGVAAEQRR